MNVLKLTFDKKKKEIDSFGNELYNDYLSTINKYTISSLAKSIYIQKQIKYHKDDDIFILKPNQKDFGVVLWPLMTLRN